MLTAAVVMAVAALAVALWMADPVVVRPKPIDDILYNPHMGFQTFQHFNGDPLFEGLKWTEVGPEKFGAKPASLENKNHPVTTVSYCRWYWDRIEPESGKYRWDILDRALATARERGQTLAIRVMCHDSAGKNDVPEWFKESGARGETKDVARGKDIKYWVPDYADPLYIKYWTRLNEEIAARYDGHPDLETVDLASIGPWGEWSTKPVNPPMWAKAALIDCYTNNWKKTPLLMQFDDPDSMRYGVERGTGWRSDCLGDMGGFSKTWSHMLDAYPEGIIKGGAVDAWKTAPVSFEVCWVMQHWQNMGWDADFIFNEAIKWHMTQFNTKSSPVGDEQWDATNKCLARMGYRFVLRKLSHGSEVKRGEMMRFTSWWENRGCAPIYRKYDLALQLRAKGTEITLKTDADITKWLPGDIVYDDAVAIPYDVPAGKYTLRAGMLDQRTGEAKIQLAQEGLSEGGWYDIGEITIG